MTQTTPDGCAVCPACHGTGRRPVPEANRKYVDIVVGYDKVTDTLVCNNCGGQTMSLRARGYTKKRKPKDTEGCTHEYVGHRAGNCYWVYNCKHCASSCDVDSGD